MPSALPLKCACPLLITSTAIAKYKSLYSATFTCVTCYLVSCFWFPHPLNMDCSLPMNCRLPGSSVYRISQAKILGWFAISFSRGSSQVRDWTVSPALAGGFFTSEPPEKPLTTFIHRWLSTQQVFCFFWLCSVACGILVPWPGIRPVSPEMEMWNRNHWTTRIVPQQKPRQITQIWVSFLNNQRGTHVRSTSQGEDDMRGELLRSWKGCSATWHPGDLLSSTTLGWPGLRLHCPVC